MIGCAKPLLRPIHCRLLIAKSFQFLVVEGAEVGEQLLVHLLPAGKGCRERFNGLAYVGGQVVPDRIVHAGAPRMPPRMLTKCCHSSRPLARAFVPFAVSW